MPASREPVPAEVTITRRRRAGGEKRSAVLDAVADVLAVRGYENTRFADVSAAGGVAISTLQTYFGSREDMVIEAMRVFTDREVDALRAVSAAEADPWRRLVALADRSLHNSERTRQVLVEFWRSAMRDDELRAYSAEVQTRYRAPFLAAVREGVERGAFTPTHDAETVTDLLLSALAGLIIFRVQREPRPMPAEFRDVLLAQLRLTLGVPASAEPHTRTD
ncbi:TetR/AcrR family transcriptional regulator [Micromonospora sp. LAH09]|uniref:TetR/AcrR family transcriptional regulator n=1 Tax=Micromonospora cabrerizensis TaxID=2911213 RepID=UPI001EE80819|nr:TetR/AcrR family transcriptional regulator [Micromonospora cabrerizensis]MCG5472953.1 TetR/AcrR family transcriptional regulator [Micromonospora cabrerizensis]